MSRRGQSSVVGVAVLLALTTVSLAAVTAGVGTVVQSHADAAAADHVADGLADTLTGTGPGTVTAATGRLRVENRSVRVLNESGVVAVHHAGAVVYETDSGTVTFLAGGLLETTGGRTRFVSAPRITVTDDTLVAGIPVVNATSRGPGGTLRRVNATHERRALGNGTFRVAVETTRPDAWAGVLTGANTTATRRDFDGDGVDSVVVRYAGERSAHLIVHDLRVEVSAGGS